MKKWIIIMMVIVAVLLLLRIGVRLFTSPAPIETQYLSKSFDYFVQQWGRPSKTMGASIYVWTKNDGVFVGAFSNEETLDDYAQFDSQRNYLSGTTEAYKNAKHIWFQVFINPFYKDHIYMIGSGAEIYARISSDGYIVIWPDGFLGALDAYLYDCIEQKDVSIVDMLH